VWVNTRSGKYWKPGSRYYGKTKEGEFMSELDALYRGYSPAGGKVKSVHEAKAEFKIEFEDGSSTTFNLADRGSSVAVRDKNNAVEYVG
jgi:hypothetical protein